MLSATDIASSFGSIYELVKKGANLDAQEAIMALRAKVVDLVGENVDLKQALNQASAKIKELEEANILNIELKFIGWAYERVSNDENLKGPYCQPCYDEYKRLSRLQRQRSGDGTSYWRCFVCTKNFYPR